MKELNFEQMEVISAAGLTQNQTCTIGGMVAMASCFLFAWGLAATATLGALYYGCF